MEKKLYELIKSVKVIIFDFDDTIAATEQYSWMAHDKALEKYNVKLTQEHIKKYIGNNDQIIFSNMENDFGISIDFKKHFIKRINLYTQLILNSDLEPFEYVKEILNTFPDKKYYILTSNSQKAILPLLTKWNILHYFTNVFSVFDLKSNKEDYIKNSINPNFFNCNHEDMILFEDSAKTINMASSYNVKTVFIKNDLNKNNQSNCDYIINTSKLIKD